MVKNTTGGKGAKSMASKNVVSNKATSRLRIAEFTGEIYAVVTKYLGNSMFHCHCMDNTLRLGHIRGKFSGRGKKDNIIAPGVWVLIGLREWDSGETTMKKGKVKLPQCDLLEVYSELDKKRLNDTVNMNWDTLSGNDPTKLESKTFKQSEEDVDFSNLKDDEIDKLIADLKSGKIQKLDLDTKDTKPFTEVDIDDI
jgi:initiation factor 1A